MDSTDRLAVPPSRRQFLQNAAGLGLSFVGLALLSACGGASQQVAPSVGEAPPETRTLRMFRGASMCISPQLLAEPLLRDEGFTDVQYVDWGGVRTEDALASGALDINTQFSAPLIMRVDAGDPIVFLSGLHVGCFELFGSDQVQAIRDLKGRTVGILELGSIQHVFLSAMAAYVGVDPRTEINFVALPGAESMKRLEEGTIDAFLGYPPEPQELRARHVGHVVVNSAVDKPWSQYYCCMIAGNKEFVQKNPVATKRAMRAILKTADFCAAQPDVAAQALVDRGYTPRLDYATQALRAIPYDRWREYDPEDTIRFYSLRLQEVGMIKATPAAIIQKGTDWRLLNELKTQLKS